MTTLLFDRRYKCCALLLIALLSLVGIFAVPHSALADESSKFLRAGVHTDWESRTVLPDYARTFYAALEEGAKPQSPTPYLIDSKYFTFTADGDDDIIGHTASSRYIKLLNIAYTDEQECSFLNKEISAQTYAAWAAFRRDHPEVFWLSGMFYYGQGTTGQTKGKSDFYFFLTGSVGADIRSPRFGGHINVFPMPMPKPLCFASVGSQRIKQGIELRDEAVKAALATIPEQATDAEKVALLNDFLCARNTYNRRYEAKMNTGDFPYSTTAWDSLRCLNPLVGTKGEATIEWRDDVDDKGEQVVSVPEAPTSEGLAAAFKVLCDAAGVNCVIEDGVIDLELSPCKSLLQSEGYKKDYVFHHWNSVEIDGLWYAVDMALNVAAREQDPAAEAPYLLVGSETVVDGVPFGEGHAALNNGMSPLEANLSTLTSSNPRFDNGPVLTNQAYADAPFHFEASAFDAGDVYGSPVSASASALAKSFTLGGEAVTGGHWEWENPNLTANDTGDFYQVMRYIENIPAATGAAGTGDGAAVAGSGGTEDATSGGGPSDAAPRVLATALVPFSIERRGVTIDSSAAAIASKTYDGSDLATFSTPPVLSGVNAGDDVVLKAEAFFEDAEIGTEKNVTVFYHLMGTDAGHYKLSTSSVTMIAAADITEPPAPVEPPATPDTPPAQAEATAPGAAPGGSSSSTQSSPPANAPAASKPAASAPSPAKTSLAGAIITLSAGSYAFNGKVRTPAVTVRLNGRTLRRDRDYTLTYPAGRKKIGVYRVTVKGCGGYTGTIGATFSITKPAMKPTKLAALKVAKRNLTVSWKKTAGNTSGYQVQYAADKKFKKGANTKYVKGAAQRSTKLAGLKLRMKYFVRVRTVYKVGGKTFYGPWSGAKSSRVK